MAGRDAGGRHSPAHLLLGVLYDDLTSAVVAALGTYPVVDDRCAAVGASGKGRYGSEVVRTPFGCSLVREFVFRMCHCFIILILLFFQILRSFAVAFAFGVDPDHREGCEHEIVNFLADIQDSRFRSVGFLERSVHADGEVLQAPVAGHRHAAGYSSTDAYGESVVAHPGGNGDVRIQYA